MSHEKVALVTGVSSGIGRVTAGLLSRSGFRVFGASRGNPEAKKVLEEVELVCVDVRDEGSVRSCVQAVLDRAGRIDAHVSRVSVIEPSFARTNIAQNSQVTAGRLKAYNDGRNHV